MGAHSFTCTAREQDPRAAYERLVDEAISDHGRDTYNGTISTTRGFRVFSSVPTTKVAADSLSRSRLEHLEKWGHCEAIAVGRAAKTTERKATFTVAPSSPAGRYLDMSATDVAAGLGVGIDRLESFSVVSSVPRYRYRNRKAGAASKIWTTSAGGDFATRAQAVAFARAELTVSALPGSLCVPADASIEVFQRTQRAPEAAVERTLVSVKVTVVATIAVDAERVFDHWLFYGWAAS